MEALLQVIIILFLARIFSETSERIGLPGITGEIGAGFLFAILFKPDDIETLTFMGEIGAIFLLFIAGYREVHVKDLKAASVNALIPTLSQIFVAFAFGFILGNIYGFSFAESLFLAVAFSPTSISVVVKTLIDTDYLSSKPGTLMLTSAIFDDIIGLFLLSVVISVATLNHFPTAGNMLMISGEMIVFLAIMAILGWKIFPFLFGHIQKMRTKEALFSFLCCWLPYSQLTFQKYLAYMQLSVPFSEECFFQTCQLQR
ncbi:MAG: cation:proton antiporter [Methanolobus sp.]